ncbi:thioredoxin [Plakobranchus ocellatus]|uniref:Thioredoxin n=1 Tax=Plakobranchus ocellatus TaxID=259542 RepID=A0AAV4BKA7_9GAST|nr:thioredoxin [Plakobranchus ocellatus]
MYSSIFSDRPGSASTEEHCIELMSLIPVRQRPYSVPFAMRQTLRDELREMEDLGVIKESSSPYASPVVVVKKKDGTNRVCIDYRRLNKLTIFDPQPMTPPADIFQGHSLGRGAIGLQDENVEKVRNAPRPKTKRDVRAFLGLVGYYKEFVPNFAAVSAPLSDLVRKGQPNIGNWGDSRERAYNSFSLAYFYQIRLTPLHLVFNDAFLCFYPGSTLTTTGRRALFQSEGDKTSKPEMKIIRTKEEFDKTIAETSILVVVDFFATWCGPCKAIAPQLETWSKEYDGEVLFIKVDVDENEETAEAAEVSAMPTFHFYKGGKKIDEVVGANSSVLEEKIKKHK